MGADISLETCLDDVARIGFDGIEKGHKLPTTGRGAQGCLGPRGLRFISGWHSTNLLVNSSRPRRLRWTRSWPCSWHGLQGHHRLRDVNAIHGNDGVASERRPRLKETSGAASGRESRPWPSTRPRQGITLVYHHHMGTIIEAEWEIDRLMAGTGPAPALLLDTGQLLFRRRRSGASWPSDTWAACATSTPKNVRPAILREVREQGLSFLEGVRRGVFTVPGDARVRSIPCGARGGGGRPGYEGWLVIEAEQDPAVRHPV